LFISQSTPGINLEQPCFLLIPRVLDRVFNRDTRDCFKEITITMATPQILRFRRSDNQGFVLVRAQESEGNSPDVELLATEGEAPYKTIGILHSSGHLYVQLKLIRLQSRPKEHLLYDSKVLPVLRKNLTLSYLLFYEDSQLLRSKL